MGKNYNKRTLGSRSYNDILLSTDYHMNKYSRLSVVLCTFIGGSLSRKQWLSKRVVETNFDYDGNFKFSKRGPP